MGQGKLYNIEYISSNAISGGTAQFNNYYNSTWIDSFSGSVDTRIDALGSFDSADYMTSANIIDNYMKSTNALSNFYPSALGKGISSQVYFNTLHSSNSTIHYAQTAITTVGTVGTGVWEGTAIDEAYLESGAYYQAGYQLSLDSGNKYSGWYGSGGKLGTAYDHSQDNTQAHTDYLLNNADDTTSGILTAQSFSGPLSGAVVSSTTFKGITPMTYSIANTRISANQNINLAKFQCPPTKKAYIYQAYACGSGSQYAISGLFIEMLADTAFPLDGSDSIYKTSSSTLLQGNSLATSDAGDCIEIRFMYSGTQSDLTGVRYGTAGMTVGVW